MDENEFLANKELKNAFKSILDKKYAHKKIEYFTIKCSSFHKRKIQRRTINSPFFIRPPVKGTHCRDLFGIHLKTINFQFSVSNVIYKTLLAETKE